MTRGESIFLAFHVPALASGGNYVCTDEEKLGVTQKSLKKWEVLARWNQTVFSQMGKLALSVLSRRAMNNHLFKII